GTPTNATLGANTAFTHTIVNDDVSIYSITPNQSSVNEGYTATFAVTTTNVAPGTLLTYLISGVSSTDFVPQSGRNLQTDFVGTVVVGADGTTSVSIPILADQTTEDSETLKVTLQGQEASITILDTSPQPAPTYSEITQHYYQYIGGSTSWSSALSEAAALSYRGLQGYLVTVTSQAENDLIAGFSSQWSVWMAASDRDIEGVWKWIAGPEEGTQFWQGAGSGSPVGGRYTNWYLPFLDDWDGGKPQGADYGTVAGTNLSKNTFNLPSAYDAHWGDTADRDATNNGYVVEYGGLPATYTITPSATSVNEGSSVTFTIDTKNIEWGKTISYTLSGISQSDLSSGSLTGTATINQNGADGRVTVSVSLAADQIKEGDEYLRLAVSGTSSLPVTVIDLTPSINISAIGESVVEGGNANFLVTTSGLAPGTPLLFRLSGVEALDVAGGRLEGQVEIGLLGTTSIVVPIIDDQVVEGTETLTLTIQGESASIKVLDKRFWSEKTGSFLADTISGTTGADSITGLDGDDLLSGGDGNDTILGGIGFDSISGGEGFDVIDGGLGSDVAFFLGPAGNYVLSRNLAGRVTVADKFGTADFLVNIQYIKFDDQLIDTREVSYLPTVAASGIVQDDKPAV
ncbi:MAG: hypothetical protein EB069_09090, partial [Actinobacteria bacterium]|nr:hypothetical protein [Actinomycetota bacterium]